MSAHRSHRNQHRRAAFASALFLAAFVGCGPSQPAEEFPSPGAAVGRLEQLSAEIQTQFEAGTPKKAHDAMHDIGSLLLKIEKPGFLKQLDAAARDEVKQAAKELFGIYTKIDGAMFHGGDASEAPEYSDVAADIDAALATFFKHVPESERQAAAQEAASDDHDHDHSGHDHDGHDHDHGDHAEDSHADDDDAHDHGGEDSDHADHDHADHDHADHDHDEAEHGEDGHSHDDDSTHDNPAPDEAASESTEVEPPVEEPAAEQPVVEQPVSEETQQ